MLSYPGELACMQILVESSPRPLLSARETTPPCLGSIGLEIVVKTRCYDGSVSCYKQKQPHITIHEVPTKQNGRRVSVLWK